MRRQRPLASLAAVALIVAVQIVSAPAASASVTELPMDHEIFDMVVDGARDHVFVSSGANESALTVLDYAGAIVTTLDIAGASGMALAGSTLYVAAFDANNITVVDTSTSPPSISGTLAIDPFTHPESIAYVAGKLWFTTGGCNSGSVQHVRINTDGTGISTGKTLGASVCPQYSTSAADPNLLLMWDETVTPQTLYLYDMSTSPVTLLRSGDHAAGGSYGHDAAFIPSGSSFVTASDAPAGFPQLSTADLSSVRTYAAPTQYANAVDVTATLGGRIAGGSRSTSTSDDVWVYDQGSTAATWITDLPNDDSVVPHGLAWSDNGDELFAAATSGCCDPVRLYVLDPLSFDTTLTVTARPANATIGDHIHLTGSLVFGDASASQGQTVTVTREDPAGTHAVGDAVTAADGSFALTDTVKVAGPSTYHATFAGAGHALPSEGSDTVSVSKLASHVSISVSDSAVTFGQAVRITGHLGNGTQSKVLELYAKPDGGNKNLIRKATVDRDGNLSASYTPSRDTTFIAHFDGDLKHRSKEDSAVTRVRVILKAKLTKFVSTSGKYKIYRGGSYAHCQVHVSPNHGGFHVRVTLQGYVRGHWKVFDRGSFKLNARSEVEFVMFGTSNVNFRVMVKLPTHTDHLGHASPWLYLRFK